MAAPNATGLVDEINVVAQGQNGLPQVVLSQLLAGQQAMQLQIDNMQQEQQAFQLQMKKGLQDLQRTVRNMEFNSQQRALNSPARADCTIRWLRNDAGELPLNPVKIKRELTNAVAATVDGLIGFYKLVIPPGTLVPRRREILMEFLGMEG